MKKIAILERTNFSGRQMQELKAHFIVDTFDNLSQEEANKIAPAYDVVIVNWLDPTPFLLKMKKGSLVALLSTGYGWITNLKEAHDKGVFVANIPGYSTEAVAEHLLALLLGITKNIFPTLNKQDNHSVGVELSGKTIGIIGLGNIGYRFAEICNFFGANVITYNRHQKNTPLAQDVSLDELLKKSDIICVSCSVNESSKNLINSKNIASIKKGAILIGSTWGIISEDALISGIEKGNIGAIAFDAALEANDEKIENLIGDKIYLTPHIAYNTEESEQRQLDICVENIISFINGNGKNIVN
ncbi:MAG: hypothetical protein K2K80_00530 [Clostridia bacterium]|nr:hypothetical protein [Clostridia bacterium]